MNTGDHDASIELDPYDTVVCKGYHLAAANSPIGLLGRHSVCPTRLQRSWIPNSERCMIRYSMLKSEAASGALPDEF
jgi:hypothetical protein